MQVEVVVVGSHRADIAPCVLLAPAKSACTTPLYLFNIPEGLSEPRFLFLRLIALHAGMNRHALEHRLFRPARGHLTAVFVDSLAPPSIAGLSSLLLR